MKRFLAALLVAITVIMLSSCSLTLNLPCIHSDNDGNGVCDKCDKDMAKKPPSTEDEVVLVIDGEANFHFVLEKDAPSIVSYELNKATLAFKKLGVEVKTVEEDAKKMIQNIEVLIGNVQNRGAEYDIDEHTLGVEGYAIKMMGSKVVISAGSTDALSEAIKKFTSIVTAPYADGDIMDEFVFTDKMDEVKIQTKYDVISFTIGSSSIRDYSIATDTQNPTYMAAAEAIRDYLYVKMGFYPDIVGLDDADKSIIINKVPKGSVQGGFEINVNSKEQLTIECAYDNMLASAVDTFLAGISAENGVVQLTGRVYQRDVDVIYYDDMGATGNGMTDDYWAIYRAHELANQCGQTVKATPGKVYRIHDTRDAFGKPTFITIKTNTDWTGAKFIIDDTDISTFDGTDMARLHLFYVLPDKEEWQIDSTEELNRILAAGLGRGTTNIKLTGVDRPVMIRPFNGTHRVYRRVGYSSFDGNGMHEMIVLDKDGNVDPSTPVFFDYNFLANIAVYEIDSEPITIKGGEFTTLASRADNVIRENGVAIGVYGGYIHRGIDVQRSNVNVIDVKHIVKNEISLNEQEAGILGSAYNGFFCADYANNVRFLRCTLTGRRCYRKYKGVGSGTPGTYDYSVHEACNIFYEECYQSNFWITIDYATGEITGVPEGTPGAQLSMNPIAYKSLNTAVFWGLGGANYTKNMQFINSTMSRFDSHAGLVGGAVIGSHVGEMSLTGGGDMLIKDSVVYADGSGSPDAIVKLRSDYGSTWDGTVTLQNVKCYAAFDTRDGKENPLVILSQFYTNWDFGYVCAFPNLIIDGIEIIYAENDERYGSTELQLSNALTDVRMHLEYTAKTPPRYSYLDKNYDGVVDGTGEYKDGVLVPDSGIAYDKDRVSANEGGVVKNKSDRENFNVILPPEFIEIRSNPNGYKFVVADTSGKGISDGAHYDDVENYGGFFGDTKFCYGDKKYVIGTAGENVGDFIFR
ncbi:MAG: hypothetical protein J6V09_03165 [Clostridia bacterium]|nr:hypothetical protein [Clostridia bacterium]